MLAMPVRSSLTTVDEAGSDPNSAPSRRRLTVNSSSPPAVAVRKVLVVDDDADIRLLVELSLQHAGMQPHCVGSGAEAIAAAPALRPDVILLDATLPDLDGVAIFRALRGLDGLAATPVIFVTGRLRSEHRQEYRSLGAAGLIAKPFDPFELPERILAILDGYDDRSMGFGER
jgi:DNA-binding response OmpR family regulator